MLQKKRAGSAEAGFAPRLRSGRSGARRRLRAALSEALGAPDGSAFTLDRFEDDGRDAGGIDVALALMLVGLATLRDR
jgi:hypothetical protein